MSAPADAPAPDLETLARRVDDAVADVERLPPEARRPAEELRRAIEAFHREGLVTLVRKLKADPRGKELLFELVDDPGLYALFLMHGLVREDLRARVAKALERARPYLQSHGGDVELVALEESTVRVRMTGACHGCSMSAATLRTNLEETLRELVPEITAVEQVKDVAEPALVPLSSLRRSAAEQKGWIPGPTLEQVVPGKPFRFDAAGTSILVLRLGDSLQAFRNACAHLGMPLEDGFVDVEAGTLTCPWHGFRFDGLTGECLTAPQAQLEAFPLRVEDGRIFVRPTAG